MRTFELEFLPSALKEWRKLGEAVRQQFIRKLTERLANPHVPAARLRNLADCYKIKLRQAGYRLVYRVDDRRITVVVVTVGKRERNEVYRKAKARV